MPKVSPRPRRWWVGGSVMRTDWFFSFLVRQYRSQACSPPFMTPNGGGNYERFKKSFTPRRKFDRGPSMDCAQLTPPAGAPWFLPSTILHFYLCLITNITYFCFTTRGWEELKCVLLYRTLLWNKRRSCNYSLSHWPFLSCCLWSLHCWTWICVKGPSGNPPCLYLRSQMSRNRPSFKHLPVLLFTPRSTYITSTGPEPKSRTLTVSSSTFLIFSSFIIAVYNIPTLKSLSERVCS